MLPAILSSFILTFFKMLGTFATPAVLGLPVRYYVLSTMIYANVQNRMYGDAYVLSLVLILMSVAIIYVNHKLIGKRRSFVTIRGKGLRVKLISLKKWRIPALAFTLSIATISCFIPLAILFLETLTIVPGDITKLTLHYWIGPVDPRFIGGEPGVLLNPNIYRAAWNSISLSVLSAIAVGFIGLLMGYCIVRGRGTILATLLDQLSFLPYLMPAIALSSIYLVMFAKPIGPIPALYGTFWLLLLVSVVKHLPFAARTGVASMMQIGKEMEEAAVVKGASWIRIFRKIIFPLTKSGFVNGFILTFISVMRELALILLLITPATSTLTTVAYHYTEQEFTQLADATTIIICVIILVGIYIIRRKVGSIRMAL